MKEPKVKPKKQKKPNPLKVTERQTIKDIRNNLTFLGWFVVRNHQSLGSMKGMPDLQACKDGISVWIEVKAPTGKLSDAQRDFIQNLDNQGHICIVAKTWSFVQAVISDIRLYMPSAMSNFKITRGVKVFSEYLEILEGSSLREKDV